MSSILSLFPIENVFICLKEIFSEAGCGIIYIDKLGRGVLPERVAGYADNLRRAKPEPSRGIKESIW